jgi:hypothetical protein
MGGMALDHHRAAGGERRGGVTTGGREGQREIRRAEHGHRAERDHAQADVGAGQGLAFRQGRIDAQLLPGACAHHGGKQAKLAHGAAAFTLQAGRGRPLSRIAASISGSPMARISSAIRSRNAARSSRPVAR